jgi:hypothetical protein
MRGDAVRNKDGIMTPRISSYRSGVTGFLWAYHDFRLEFLRGTRFI